MLVTLVLALEVQLALGYLEFLVSCLVLVVVVEQLALDYTLVLQLVLG